MAPLNLLLPEWVSRLAIRPSSTSPKIQRVNLLDAPIADHDRRIIGSQPDPRSENIYDLWEILEAQDGL